MKMEVLVLAIVIDNALKKKATAMERRGRGRQIFEVGIYMIYSEYTHIGS